MSESEDDSGPGNREVAYRIFAAEFEDADLTYSESDEERAPNYVVTPTGARVNRLFVVGVLTEVEPVSDDVLRARVVDPTGAFVLYAGQYQPDERAFLERADPPAFVAVTGKARTFQPEDSDRVFSSVRPESISEVDAETRDRWTVGAAEQTIDRVEAAAAAIASGLEGAALREGLQTQGIGEGLATGIDVALDHYGTTPTYLQAVRRMGVDAARLVAGEADEVEAVAVAPDASGDVQATDLVGQYDPNAIAESAPEPEAESTSEAEPDPDESEPTPDPDAVADADSRSGTLEAGSDSPSAESAEPATADTPATTAEPSGTAVDAEPDGTGDPEPSEPDDAATSADATETDSDGPGDFEPGEYDLDEDEREEIEDEYGTEFQTGAEVDEPGTADIETPDPEDIEAEDGAPDTGTPEDESEPESGADEPAEPAEPDEPTAEPASEDADTSEPDESAEAEPDADVDVEDAAVEAMEELDDGEGADRDAVVEAVVDRTGADPEAVDEAIQEALMDGRCYEPAEDRLKSI